MSRWDLRIVGVLVSLCLFFSAIVRGQSASTPAGKTPDPKKVAKQKRPLADCIEENGHIICRMKESDPAPLGPIQVPNSSKVIVRVTDKSPFDDCVLADVKLTDIKPSDPIVSILQLLTKAMTGGALPADVMQANVTASQKPLDQRTPAEILLGDLLDMSKNIQDELNDSATDVANGLSLAQKIDQLFSAPPLNKANYNLRVPPIEGVLQDQVSGPERSLEAEQLRYAFLHDRLKDVISKGPQNTPDSRTISSDEKALDTIAGQLAALKSNYDAIGAARSQFKALVAFLNQTDLAVNQADASIKNPFVKDLPLLPYNQQNATTSVSCSNTFSKKASTPQIGVNVLYQGTPRLSVSVGPLLSTISKQKLGTNSVSTGVDPTGKPTFKSVFAVVDHAPVQVIPFAFFNCRIYDFERSTNPTKPPMFSINASVGVGVNPNSGSNEVEFFVGPSIGIKKLLIQFGDHIGRFQQGFTGGFNIGDTVPAGFPTTLPIQKVYRNGFGIALSYKLPL